jgi:Tfp pilus assembly protein PilE
VASRHLAEAHCRTHPVELLIVVAIIATLASIAVPIYMGLMERARIAKAMADIRILESEIAMFELDRTRLPVNLGEINRAVLKDPWDNPYEYLSFAAAARMEGKAERPLSRAVELDLRPLQQGKERQERVAADCASERRRRHPRQPRRLHRLASGY